VAFYLNEHQLLLTVIFYKHASVTVNTIAKHSI